MRRNLLNGKLSNDDLIKAFEQAKADTLKRFKNNEKLNALIDWIGSFLYNKPQEKADELSGEETPLPSEN